MFKWHKYIKKGEENRRFFSHSKIHKKKKYCILIQKENGEIYIKLYIYFDIQLLTLSWYHYEEDEWRNWYENSVYEC